MSVTANAQPQPINSKPPTPTIVGQAPVLTGLLRRAQSAAASNLPIVVSGESGTGKELLARFLHDHSPRAQGPYVVLNCAAIPRELIDSELFGHERGAFTGARESHSGWFQAAHLGTLVLDEIGELPLELQPKLLRVLEDGVVTRVGSRKGLAYNVRIIAVTNRDLQQECAAKQFRLDLFHRLAGVELKLPPLRDRAQDLPSLIAHFAKQAACNQGLPLTTDSKSSLSPAAYAALAAYPWPGNVRELRHLLARTVALHGYPFRESELLAELPPPARQSSEPFAWPTCSRAADGPDPSLDKAGWMNLKDKTWSQVEAELIRYQLAHAKGNRRQAARALGISRTTLYERLRQLPPTDLNYPGTA